MASPLLVWKLLHCTKIKRRKALSSNIRDDGNNKGTSRRRRSHRIKVKLEKSDFGYEQSTCRVCLKQGDIPIYGCVDVSEDLNMFTSIEVAPDDSYPQYLCESCNSLLESAILLRKTAQNSDQLLKQAAQNIDTTNVEMNTSVIESDNDYDDEDWLETIKSDKRKISEDYYSSDYDEESRKKNRARALNEKDTTTLEDLLREFGEYKEAKVKFEEVRPKTFHCMKCNIDFDTMEEYSAHRLSAEHDNLRKNCPICNNSYNAAYLRKHLALHKKEKPYMCDVCGKKFAIQGQFSRHRVTHFIEDLPFKCSVCPYRGRFRENLNLHMRTHTNDKRYQCPQCPTRYFINKSNLNRHMLTHKTDHDFKCNQCQRGFYRKRDLELHFKVDHNGIKDHVCDLCGKAFGFRKQMMKHQLKVHKREKMRSGRTPLYLILASKKQNEDSSNQETNDQTVDFEKSAGDVTHNIE